MMDSHLRGNMTENKALFVCFLLAHLYLWYTYTINVELVKNKSGVGGLHQHLSTVLKPYTPVDDTDMGLQMFFFFFLNDF